MTEQQNETPPSPRKKKGAFSIVFISLLIFILYIGLAMGYYCGYNILTQLAHAINNESAARQQAETNIITQLSAFNARVNNLDTTVKAQAASLKNANQNDVSSLNIQTAYDLTVLADNELSVSNNVNGALILLNSAEALLKQSDDPKTAVILTAIEKNMADLKRVPAANVATLYLAVTELNKTIRQLPFSTDIMQPSTQTETTQGGSSIKSSDRQATAASLWQTGWEAAKNALQKIVIVQHNPATILPIALPTQKAALFQTIDAALLQTKWAVLNQNQSVYNAALEQTKSLVNDYFRVDAKSTAATLERIAELEKWSVTPPKTDLSNTLQLFNAYLVH